MTAKPKKPSARSLARLLAVQGIYLVHMNDDATAEGVLEDLRQMSLGEAENMPLVSEVDQTLLSDILIESFKRRDDIRKNLDEVLSKNWKYERLETVLASILEAGTYELLARPDIPHAVIINEYINATHAFYEGDEPGFVNGILNELAKRLRG